ncbi:MAG: hypothetical protein IK126_09765 [Bacteroidales bacterium]|nr:hypothetical protein [Bacteroidales bacterium]
MNSNPNQDIEQLLQQYAEDRRQQSEAARRVRGMASRQRRIVATVACVALLVLVGVPMVRLILTGQDSPSGIILAEASPMPVSAPQSVPSAPPTASNTTTTLPHVKHTPRLVVPATTKVQPVYSDTSTLLPLEAIQAPVESLPPQTEVPPTVTPAKVLPVAPSPLPTAEVIPPAPQSRRLHLTAQVGGSTTAPSGYEYSYLNAGVGVSVALVSGGGTTSTPRYEMAMGVSVDGYLNTRAFRHWGTKYDYFSPGFNSIDAIEGYSSSDEIIEITWLYPNYALYATLPFTFDLYPRGHKSPGYLFSLTPGRAVTPVSNIIGGRRLKGINPWKLTFGIGVTFPNSFLHSLSFTANLLPSYIEGPLENVHEVGLVFGF